MENLENFAINAFNYIDASKEKILDFFTHHENALIQSVKDGAPFAALIIPTSACVQALRESMNITTTNVAEQKSKTFTVDQCIERFVAKAKEFEPGINDKFKKGSAIYIEFYPQGMKPFNQITKKSVESLMAQFISAFANHETEAGVAKHEELKQIRDDYTKARNLQEQKKTETKSKRASWDDCLKAMQEQAFINLLTIAMEYRNKPEKLKLFFDQSIVAKRRNNGNNTETGYILPLAINGSEIANISFSVDDKFLVINNGIEDAWYCGLVSATTIPNDDELIKIPAGDEIEVSALSLGAPTKRYWYFKNKSTSNPGEIEIIQL